MRVVDIYILTQNVSFSKNYVPFLFFDGKYLFRDFPVPESPVSYMLTGTFKKQEEIT